MQKQTQPRYKVTITDNLTGETLRNVDTNTFVGVLFEDKESKFSALVLKEDTFGKFLKAIEALNESIDVALNDINARYIETHV